MSVTAIQNSNVSSPNFKAMYKEITAEEISQKVDSEALEEDIVEISHKTNKKNAKKSEPPSLGFWRLATGFINRNQVKQINEAGRLPDNAKFVMEGYGRYSICNNMIGFRVGTQELPQGFEVKQNAFGVAVVLPKGSKGALIRSGK